MLQLNKSPIFNSIEYNISRKERVKMAMTDKDVGSLHIMGNLLQKLKSSIFKPSKYNNNIGRKLYNAEHGCLVTQNNVIY
jgi:hypothetical protein